MDTVDDVAFLVFTLLRHLLKAGLLMDTPNTYPFELANTEKEFQDTGEKFRFDVFFLVREICAWRRSSY
jgi:hypothetical protein